MTGSFRQVHLDFHTSEFIEDVGKAFSKKDFQDSLTRAKINSITLFAKCHHGWSYYPTRVGTVHPHLCIDLLNQQLDACRQINVRTPIYLSAGVDENYLRNHPDHAMVNKNRNDPLRIGFTRICLNSCYVDYLCRQIEECAENFNPDGIFLDIVGLEPCYCPACRKDMLQQGLDVNNDADAFEFASTVQKRYFQRTLASARKINPEMRVFQNAGHIFKGDRDFLKYVSHLELESLPTGGWGYDHFPASAKYAASIGADYLGMTGKFHTTWGEFGGFKHKNALKYETSLMLAYGAKCSIGDQLHPSGKMNPDTYNLIGQAYEDVAKKEIFCENATPVSEVALLSTEALNWEKYGPSASVFSSERSTLADKGAQRMLLETHILFDVIDSFADFRRYRMIIIPDERLISEMLARKLADYMSAGGKLMLSYKSALKPGKDEFYFDIGNYKQDSFFNPEYIQISEALLAHDRRGNLIKSPFVIYGGSVDIETGCEVWAYKINPYLNRTREHFCSHHHFPEHTKSDFPAAVINKGNIVYFANSIFTQYAEYGQMLFRDTVIAAMDKALGELSFYSSLGSSGRVSLMHQPQKNRFILHLLYAVPVKRAGNAMPSCGLKDIEVIEDIIPLRDVSCSIKFDRNIKKVYQALANKEINWSQSNGRINFVVDEINCHQVIVFEY